MKPQIGEVVWYHGYSISHPIEEDFIVEVAHDTLKEAKVWIDRLLKVGELEKEEDKEVPK